MNIFFGNQIVEGLEEKYTVLELDSFLLPGAEEPVTSYCVVENISLFDIPNIEQFRDLHQGLMRNYKLRNWTYCENALEHLIGKWNSELDTFYLDIAQRVATLKDQDLDDTWTPVIDRTI